MTVNMPEYNDMIAKREQEIADIDFESENS